MLLFLFVSYPDLGFIVVQHFPDQDRLAELRVQGSLLLAVVDSLLLVVALLATELLPFS